MEAGLTDAVQSVDGDGFERAPHHGVLLEHLVEMVDGEGEEAAVRVGAHAGGSPPLGEQTDLCVTGTQRGKQRRNTKMSVRGSDSVPAVRSADRKMRKEKKYPPGNFVAH